MVEVFRNIGSGIMSDT